MTTLNDKDSITELLALSSWLQTFPDFPKIESTKVEGVLDQLSGLATSRWVRKSSAVVFPNDRAPALFLVI